ncbi:MAG: hypothetical protein ACKOCK_00810, partial [Chloroflexota bacterium]
GSLITGVWMNAAMVGSGVGDDGGALPKMRPPAKVSTTSAVMKIAAMATPSGDREGRSLLLRGMVGAGFAVGLRLPGDERGADISVASGSTPELFGR